MLFFLMWADDAELAATEHKMEQSFKASEEELKGMRSETEHKRRTVSALVAASWRHEVRRVVELEEEHERSGKGRDRRAAGRGPHEYKHRH
ncbi:hypothetical protein ACFX2J_009295 [Malus domestica]